MQGKRQQTSIYWSAQSMAPRGPSSHSPLSGLQLERPLQNHTWGQGTLPVGAFMGHGTKTHCVFWVPMGNQWGALRIAGQHGYVTIDITY